MKTRPRIGIIGYGMVGAAVGAWFKDAAKYSPHQFPSGMTAVNKAEIVFLCTPSPYSAKTGYDLSAITTAAKKLTGRKIIVLKSTVLPGTTEKLQRRFPRHRWLFNPEFLQDRTSRQDFFHPDRQIIGLAANTDASRRAAKRVMRLLPSSPQALFMTSTEAELVKLFANSFFATKVVFANMIYDAATRLGADYEIIRDGIGHDPRIGTSVMRIWQDGFRGFSGKCLPKDMGALIWWGRHHGPRLPFLETVDHINRRLLPKRQRHR